MEIREYEVPNPEPGTILLKITQAGICGTDLHSWRGTMSAAPIPPSGRAMGHEGNGVIYALGKGVTTDALGQPIHEGDRVVHTAIRPCNRCHHCLNGNHNWCPTGLAARPAGEYPYFVGTYADYYYVEPNQPTFRVPPELPEEALSFINCAMGTVAEALLRAGAGVGQHLVIQGAGGLGLNAVAIAKQMGVHNVIVLDRLPNRLQLAREFGADSTVNIDEYNTPEARRQRVWELTDGHGADIVLELVGRAELLPEGIEFLANGGTFMPIGSTGGRTISFDPSTLLRGKKVMGTYMYRPKLLPMLMAMLVKIQGKVPYHKLISHRFPLADVNEAFAQADWAERQTPVTRAVLVP
jgi:threonine dehydrogenase-like Zn-dependent dehydrogenase